jgi:hypothetical protein
VRSIAMASVLSYRLKRDNWVALYSLAAGTGQGQRRHRHRCRGAKMSAILT